MVGVWPLLYLSTRMWYAVFPYLYISRAYQNDRRGAKASDCHVQGRGRPGRKLGRELWLNSSFRGLGPCAIFQEAEATIEGIIRHQLLC